MPKSQLRKHNQVQLLCNGADFFPALLAQIHAAQIEIHLETYIFELDEVGEQIAQALMAAARRGVRVSVLIDGFGARDFPVAIKNAMAQAGVRLLFFRPELKRFSFNRARLRRMHRKLSCFDGKVAFVGGINILSDFDGPDLPPRYDYAVQLSGPIVDEIRAVLSREWRHSAWSQLKKSWTRRYFLSNRAEYTAGVPAQLVVRDNTRNRAAIEHAYLAQIEAAQSEIIIANAYFLPGKRLRQALLRAAARGVAVVLLLQDERDHALLQYASWAFYRPLLKAGVEIYQYNSGFMHAKVAIFDGEWATVGSSNIDPFSLLLAREANVFIHDPIFAQQLRLDVKKHLNNDALAILPEHIHQAGIGLRALVWMSYTLVRLMMGVSGYGGNKYLE
ncbi:cardiolipin synthase ClsB [Chitinibacter bivalviorum]|uniref:Cardiolipin synthase B n=1 Tax=Chitinibacter bivalviorum TaxID=2739434 RepID=A0A7H9BHU8_9NEIS|nr:cardiolipin synthase ClsB [Chitinibacter bivalviorum]QLG87846.1 cardiolipin synthase ClsB [Chitinibacter bivalviorum]